MHNPELSSKTSHLFSSWLHRPSGSPSSWCRTAMALSCCEKERIRAFVSLRRLLPRVKRESDDSFSVEGEVRKRKERLRRVLSGVFDRGVDSNSSLKEILEDIPVRVPGLQFNRLQQRTEEPESLQGAVHEFKRFLTREAVLDEELWTAAWLRAESHWEEQEGSRYADNLKRKFAEQEFNAMKRRCKGQYGPRCMCIVAVWKDQDGMEQSVLKSMVGTVDLSIRCLSQGETFPGERVRPPSFCSIDGARRNSSYGYVANLCVAKSARRQGIATNMMKFTTELAKAFGVEQLYAHVHRRNRRARELYSKLGFEIVAEATTQLAEEQQYLLCLDIQISTADEH